MKRSFGTTPGLTNVKVVLRDYSTGAERLWYTAGTPAFEAYNASHIASYGITATEGTGGRYSYNVPATLPASAAGIPYIETAYETSGSLATTDFTNDTRVAEGEFPWTGTAAIDTVATITDGDGDLVVDHDTGGIDTLRVVTSGQGVDGVIIRAYVKTEYDANASTATVRGQAVTGSDGRWVQPMYLNAGITYTLTFHAPSGYLVQTINVTP